MVAQQRLFVTVTVSTCAGLNALTDNAGIQTFPNPNSGQLFVTYNGFTQGASIEVYNTVGQLMLKKNIESSTTEMNLNNYSNGIYIVKVLSAKGKIEQVTKLIKD
ncbi:MAG: T9SS type A sorting domain-containing protein [Sphingobacteriaceae bacterium]|nr:T9SS type A sorting domain-containing protein [Sphingobacteriaceae bacterium]